MTDRSVVGLDSPPFIGALAYTEERRGSFHGRRREARELEELIIVQRIVVVHAPSGSGKTSLLQAFLIPELRDGRNFCVPQNSLRPTQLQDQATEEDGKDNLTQTMRRRLLESYGAAPSKDALASCAAALQAIRETQSYPGSENQPVLVVVDQLEELFGNAAFDARMQRAVMTELALMAEDESVWMALAIREDYLARLLAFDELFHRGGLRTRFGVPLFTGLIAEEVLANTLSGVGVEIGRAQLRKLALTLAECSLPTRIGTTKPEQLLEERVVEPLFLQLAASHWWRESKGEPRSLERASITKETVSDAIVKHLNASFNAAAAEMRTFLGGADAAETDLRLGVENELTDNEDRKQGLLDAKLSEGAIALETAGILRRSHPSSDRLELAHDQLVHALRVSNQVWMSRNDLRRLAYFQHAWKKTYDSKKLLSAYQAASWFFRRSKLSAPLWNYVRVSLLQKLLFPAAILLVFAFVALVAVLHLNRLKGEKDALLADTEKALTQYESEAHRYALQSQIARSYGSLAAQDLAKAASTALSAHLSARASAIDRADFTARSEALLGRISSVHPAVDRWKVKGVGALQFTGVDENGNPLGCTGGKAFSLIWSTRTLELHPRSCKPPANTAPTALTLSGYRIKPSLNRVHLGVLSRRLKGVEHFKVRNAYAFLELSTSSDSPWDRRAWPTFGSQALIDHHGSELEFPPREEITEIVAGNLVQLTNAIAGFSLSARGRLYTWHASEGLLRKCADDRELAPDDQNDACRALTLDRPVQLFPGHPVSVTAPRVTRTADGAQFVVYAAGEDRTVARITWRSLTLRSVWPSKRMAGNRGSEASSFFFDRHGKRTWLLNAAAGPTLLDDVSVEPQGKELFLRAIWCSDDDCSERKAAMVGRDGALGWLNLDDPGAKVKVVKPEGSLAKQHLRLADVTPLTNNHALAVGFRLDDQAPIVALLHADPKSEALGIESSSEQRNVVHALDGNVPTMIRRDGNLVVVAGEAPIFTVCRIAGAVPKLDLDCRSVPTLGSVSAISIGRVPLKNQQVPLIAVGLADGSVHFFQADGKPFVRPTEPGERSSSRPAAFDAHYGPVRSTLVFTSADGISRLATGGDDGRVRAWVIELRTSQELAVSTTALPIATHDGYVSKLAFESGSLWSSGERSNTFQAPVESMWLKRAVCTLYSPQPVTVKLGRIELGRAQERTIDSDELCGRRRQ